MKKISLRVLHGVIKRFQEEKGHIALWELVREVNSRRDFVEKTFDARCPRCFSKDVQQELASYKDTSDWLECQDCGLRDFGQEWKYWEHRNKEAMKDE